MAFKSSNFVFRQSVMGQAFAALGITSVPMLREERITGILADPKKNSRTRTGSTINLAPSRRFMIDPAKQYHRNKPEHEPKHRTLIPLEA